MVRVDGATSRLVWPTAAFLVLAMLYNRARHFGWKRAHAPLLYAALACGVAAVVVSDGHPRPACCCSSRPT